MECLKHAHVTLLAIMSANLIAQHAQSTDFFFTHLQATNHHLKGVKGVEG